MKVAVLPTGRTEWTGLARALARLFPDHEFYCLPTEAEVLSEAVGFPYPGFTSLLLADQHEANPPEVAIELVVRAAQEVLGSRRKKPADHVIIIDDIELTNVHQPERVLAVMRKAVEVHLSGLDGGVHQKTRAMLLERVSFHLVVPMIEGWFFADPLALVSAGVSPQREVSFDETSDPEAFETEDRAYLSATEADCPAFAALPTWKKKKLRPSWLGSLPRERHPKGYLQWLCLDGEDRSCTCYSETRNGSAALAGIRWEILLSRPAAHFSHLRSLIEDLEDCLGCPSAVGPVEGSHFGQTSRSSVGKNAVLRNI